MAILGTITSGAIKVFVILTALIISGGLGFLLRYVLKWRRIWNEFQVVIFQHDGAGHLHIRKDKAGVFTKRKTKTQRLWLKNSKSNLDADKIPYLQSSGNKRTVYLLQTGAKNYRYLKFNIDSEKFGFSIGEEDVNWALTEYESDKNLMNESRLMQYLPIISLTLVSFVILILFIYLFKKFDVLKDIAVSLKDASKNLALAKTTVIQ